MRFVKMPAALLAAALLLLLLPSCAQSRKPGDVTLRVWFSSFEAENAALREIAGDFYAETGIRVEVFSSNFFDILSRFPNAAETDERPDIVFMQSTDLGSLIESGYLAKADFLPADIHRRYEQAAFDGFSYQGGLYGMGYSTDTYGLLYNKALVPSPPGTWDELYQMADDLTLTRDGQTTQWGLLLNAGNLWFTYPLLKSFGGYYMGQNAQGAYNPDDIGLDGPGMVAGVRQLQWLQQKGQVLEDRTKSDSHIVKRFADGRVAMTFYGLWSAELFLSSGVDYGLAPLPQTADGRRSRPLTAIQGFVLNRFSRRPEEAKQFFSFIFEDANQQRLIEAANGHGKKTGVRNTCNLAVAQSDYVQSSEILSAQYLVGRQAEVFPNNPEGPLIWNYAQSVMSSIFYPYDGRAADVQAKLSEFREKLEGDIATQRGRLNAGSNDQVLYYALLAALALLACVYAAVWLWRRRRGHLPLQRAGARDNLVAWAVLAPFMGMMLLFYLYPILDNINLSMTDYSNLRLRDYSYVGFANYRAIFSGNTGGFLSMLLWTVVFALCVVVFSFLLGAVLAVLLDKAGVRVAKIYRVIFILPMAVPSVITLLMWQGLLDTGDGLVNSLLGLWGLGPVPWLTNPVMARVSTILVMSWFSFPYYLTVSQGIISNIPRDYYEAMRMDGGGALTCFARITLPTVVRAILPVLLMGFIMQFNQFGVYMLTGGGPAAGTLGAPGATDLLITYVFNTAFNTGSYALAAAYSVVIFMLVGLFAVLALRTANRGGPKARKGAKQ